MILGKRGRARGQALVELALVLPLLLLFLAGVFDVGRAFSQAGVVTNAARTGARYGAFQPTDISVIKNRVIEETNGSDVTVLSDNIEVTTPEGASPGKPITVKVTYEFTSLLGSVLRMNTVRIVRECTMVIL